MARQVARSSASLDGMEADPRIVLHRPGGTDDLIVDHPGQPADYLHTDGTLWTWRERWRPTGGVLDERGGRRGGTLLRVYDPVIPRPGFTLTRAVGPHPKQRPPRRISEVLLAQGRAGLGRCGECKPSWWAYPTHCRYGHPWGRGWSRSGGCPAKCLEAKAARLVHLWVRCRAAPNCPSIWHWPTHLPSSESH